MTENKNWEYLAQVEKAISEKYGKEAIINPKALWNAEKEQSYLQQIKEIHQNEPNDSDLEDCDGVLIPKKLINKENNRICVSCKKYSFDKKDDLYINKFRCCFRCYIQYVEGREDKWLQLLK